MEDDGSLHVDYWEPDTFFPQQRYEKKEDSEIFLLMGYENLDTEGMFDPSEMPHVKKHNIKKESMMPTVGKCSQPMGLVGQF